MDTRCAGCRWAEIRNGMLWRTHTVTHTEREQPHWFGDQREKVSRKSRNACFLARTNKFPGNRPFQPFPIIFSPFLSSNEKNAPISRRGQTYLSPGMDCMACESTKKWTPLANHISSTLFSTFGGSKTRYNTTYSRALQCFTIQKT